ncbi:MAG: sterol desaturase family protein [Nitriliruptorales bacterium]|nr:sterol desaturase family protein [Nitriliruptorales bacterium]
MSTDVLTDRDTGERRRSLGLDAAAREFWRWPSPRIIALLLVPSLAARVAIGGWSAGNTVLAASMVLAQPFVEWVVHIVLLHMRPRHVGRFTLDPLFARKHREHHADPRETRLVFLPTIVVAQLAVVAVLVAWLAFDSTSLGLTFLVTISAIGMAYEWLHYLIHTDYRPKSALYRALWRHHRLHHFKNENYWFAFSSTVPDVILRTTPDPSNVETSPTVRDLLGRDRLPTG